MLWHSILNRYLARQFLTAFAAVMVAVMGLILLFDIIELLRRTANREVGFADVLLMAAFKLPHMIETVLPFAAMIGAMIVFWRLARSHELVAIRSVGVSVWEFLGPVLSVVLLIGLFSVTVLNPVAAAMYNRYEQMQDRFNMRHSNPLAFSESGLWLREVQSTGRRVVNAEDARQDGLQLAMRGVTVLDFDIDNRFVRRIEAERGALNDGLLYLEDAHVMQPGAPVDSVPAMALPTNLSLGQIQENFASPETISFWELPRFIGFFESAGFSAQAHRLHWHSLIASPVLLVAMVLVAAVFSLSPNTRRGGVLLRIVAGVLSGFVLFFFSKVTFALGVSAVLPVWLAAWAPGLVSMLLSVSALLHFEDG